MLYISVLSPHSSSHHFYNVQNVPCNFVPNGTLSRITHPVYFHHTPTICPHPTPIPTPFHRHSTSNVLLPCPQYLPSTTTQAKRNRISVLPWIFLRLPKQTPTESAKLWRERESMHASGPDVRRWVPLRYYQWIVSLTTVIQVFTRAEHRRRHELSHEPRKQYPCTYEGCKKAFHRPDYLTQHLGRQWVTP